jgi:(p)ppGpp synthase/HD superfamily hydrolase
MKKSKIELAIQLATLAHTAQKRDNGEPYITHPLKVAEIMRLVTSDEDIICAAILHDVIEDSTYKYKVIKEGWGKRVADIVKEVSKDKDKKFHIKTKEGALIKLADTLHNLADASEEKKSSYIKRKITFISKVINEKTNEDERQEMLEFFESHGM